MVAFSAVAAHSVGRVFSLCFKLFPVLVLGLGLGSGCFGSCSLRAFYLYRLPLP